MPEDYSSFKSYIIWTMIGVIDRASIHCWQNPSIFKQQVSILKKPTNQPTNNQLKYTVTGSTGREQYSFMDLSYLRAYRASGFSRLFVNDSLQHCGKPRPVICRFYFQKYLSLLCGIDGYERRNKRKGGGKSPCRIKSFSSFLKRAFQNKRGVVWSFSSISQGKDGSLNSRAQHMQSTCSVKCLTLYRMHKKLPLAKQIAKLKHTSHFYKKIGKEILARKTNVRLKAGFFPAVLAQQWSQNHATETDSPVTINSEWGHQRQKILLHGLI